MSLVENAPATPAGAKQSDFDAFAADRPTVLPLTQQQQEVWLESQMSDDANCAFNETLVIGLEGALSPASIERGLNSVIARHAGLRATFAADGESQQIAPEFTIAAPLIDLRTLEPEAQRPEIDRIVREELAAPFDLANGPLIRAQLLREGAETWRLIVTAHHIVCDGWSAAVLCTELAAAYEADGFGLTADLPAPADYAAYVHFARDAERTAADEAYWLDRLSGAPQALDLPTDRPRGPTRSRKGARLVLRIEEERYKRLKAVGAKEGATLFATTFAAVQTLLYRLSGQEEFVLGFHAAGQLALDNQNIIAHCVSTLPIPLTIEPETPLSQQLKPLARALREVQGHSSLSFGALLPKLSIDRDPGRAPLVSATFNMEQALGALAFGDVQVTSIDAPKAHVTFDLVFNAVDSGRGLEIECDYSSDLFDADTVRSWLGGLDAVISAMCEDPHRAPNALHALAEADRARLLGEWNATARPYPRDALGYEAFEAQAAARPEAVALVFGGEEVSYRALSEQSSRLAGRLAELGVGDGALVGLHLERSLEMVAAMLAVWKAGAAYLPLDPSFPEERLRFMIEDSGAALVLTQAASAGARPGAPVRFLELDDAAERAAIAAAAPVARRPAAGAEALAYVLYTSGSTGRPKGVEITHRALVNFLDSMAEQPGLGAEDRLLAVTTMSFDISLLELFLPLTVGGRVALAARDDVADDQALIALIEGQGITAMQATPATWRLLIDGGWKGAPGLKALCGGEALPPRLAGELLERVGELWNMYGPTETTIWSTCAKIESADRITVGRPIGNTRIYVLDDHGQLVPPGLMGELWIGGDGVARGYLGRPELTAERFQADPFSDEPGARMYRTGDWVRLLSDGTIAFQRRRDDQVKVRGFRIELGEIETALAAHETIAEAAVVVRADDDGDARLIAFIRVALGAAAPEDEALRVHLRARLPYYMIPQHIVSVEVFPRTLNGKLDRRKLAEQVDRHGLTQQAGGAGPDQAARTPTEATVLQAFEEVLKHPGLGVGDDFFAFGGHSLLATKLTARLNKELGIALALRAIFEAPTPRAMAAVIDRALAQDGPKQIALARQADQSQGPLTLMQNRIRLMEEMYPGRVIYNTPSAHRLTGPFDRAAFETALRSLVDRHGALRTWIDAEGDEPSQRVAPSLAFDLPFEDLSGLSDAEREPELMRRIQALVDEPIAIGDAPLFRVKLWRLADQEHVFLFMPHHIVWDGWSFDVLYQEMAILYPAALEGRAVEQPAPAATYVDFAAWQQEWTASEHCRAQIDYWRDRFGKVDPPGLLPTDRPRRAQMTGDGAVDWLHVDKALTERLRAVALEHGATLNTLVMGVYVAMIGQMASSQSLMIGVPIRGRQIAELDNVMGFFNNLLPIHFQLQPDAALPSWIKTVKDELLDAFAHQDVPFELLAGEPEIARHTRHLYQCLFSFQDARERPRRWGPLQHASVLVMQKGATEDFGLWLMEVPHGLEGGLNYNTDLFDADTVHMLRERLLGLMRRVAEQPYLSVEALVSSPGADRDAMLAWITERKAASAQAAPVVDQTAKAPQPAAEPSGGERIAAIWAELLGLGVEDIHPDDNFFDLGGNSLLAIRAVLLTEKSLGVRLDPSRMVNESLWQLAATPATIAAAATADQTAPTAETAPPATTGAAQPRAPLKRLVGSERRTALVEKLQGYAEGLGGLLSFGKSADEEAALRAFLANRDENLFFGVFDSWEAARAQSEAYGRSGYDNEASAALYDVRIRMDEHDYPALCWLMRSMNDGHRSVVDLGGSIGIKYLAFREALAPWPDMRWTVHDVPAAVARGRELAREREGAQALGFADTFEEGDGCDVLYASGVLQYLPETLDTMLSGWRSLPKRIVINTTPIHPEHAYFTVNSIGTAFCPYRVQTQAMLVRGLTRLGYRLRESWRNPEKLMIIPLHPERSLTHYSGYCLDLAG